MTERLYYNDSELLEFESVITVTGERDGRCFTQLEQSAFYPTSGGQSHDTGTLNGVEVIEVTTDDTGEVWHWTDQPVGRQGDRVTGSIDRERRFRNSRNHTGQHLLSAAFDRLFGLLTVSVHLGEEYAAVELEAASIDAEQLQAAEELCNEIIGDNIPVATQFIDSAKADSYPLRKPPPKEGQLRIIQVGDFECSACGGTHCRTTGGVGLIKIVGVEKIRSHSLVKFFTGKLAYDDYRVRFEVTDTLARDLTCHPRDLPEKVAKLSEQVRATNAALAAANKELFPIKVEQLASGSKEINGHSVVLAELPGFDPALAPKLATQVADRIDGLAALMLERRIVLAVAENSPVDAGAVAKQMAAGGSLKGGGNKRQAQLGGVEPSHFDSYRSTLEKIIADG